MVDRMSDVNAENHRGCHEMKTNEEKQREETMFCFTIPSFIMNIEHGGGKCWCAGAVWYSGVIAITQSGVLLPLRVPHILAEHHI